VQGRRGDGLPVDRLYDLEVPCDDEFATARVMPTLAGAETLGSVADTGGAGRFWPPLDVIRCAVGERLQL